MSYPVSRKGDGLRRALFLCEDNYLAGRFCEELFNSLIRGEGLNWQAVSRAYRTSAARGFSEPMAPEAVAFLRNIGTAPANHRRLPLGATPFDFEMSSVVVALAPSEQFVYVTGAWREFAGRIELWEIDLSTSVEARLRACTSAVSQMIDVMLGRATAPSAQPPLPSRSARVTTLSARAVAPTSLRLARHSNASNPGGRMEPVGSS